MVKFLPMVKTGSFVADAHTDHPSDETEADGCLDHVSVKNQMEFSPEGTI